MNAPATRSTREAFDDELLAGMRFLNEAPERYPDAISMASGRPDVAAVRSAMPWLDDALRAGYGERRDDRLLNYGPTAGVVVDALADWVSDRSAVEIAPDGVIVTTGCQEAMMTALLALCEPRFDAVLVSDPAYVGILGAAAMLGLTTISLGPVAVLGAAAIERGVAAARRAGLRAKAVYLVPDYDNPTGDCLGAESRDDVVECCLRHGLTILEDVAYREFGYDGERRPSLLSSGAENVVQLGTFAKILVPGLRLGYVATLGTAATAAFTGACLCAKSFSTLNTSTLTQQVLREAIGERRSALLDALGALRLRYAAKRDAVLDALRASGLARRGVTWNVPQGGFFLSVRLPFAFGERELADCASRFGVICTPMRYFALGGASDNDVRLAFSMHGTETLREGISRFAAFVAAAG
ncbi:MAG TPA: PLP-dependent aminotransferase family protein [Candidatus Elarobacter sp.]|nr:PLP-dependent aminotransferase family protein [Candidatus Elarobacter sp.]